MIRFFQAAFLPVLALASFAFAVMNVMKGQRVEPPPPPPKPPVVTPYAETVAGAGIVEAKSENIAIAAEVAGVVRELFVHEGAIVRKGDPLFRLDDRRLAAELNVHRAAVVSAERQLERLEQLPRPEEIPPAEAKAAEAKAKLDLLEDQLGRAKRLASSRSIGDEALVARQQEYTAAREAYARANAELALLKAGTWEPELNTSRAGVEQARAQREAAEIEISRLTVTAPIDGQVLQVNIRPGEYVGTPPNQTVMLLGDTSTLHVRVDIDEHDIPRFEPKAPATATVRGSSGMTYELEYVRTEPYVVPKRSLTGDNTERVDTRVMQVIYAIVKSPRPLLVGQQMDVFVNVPGPPIPVAAPPAVADSTSPAGRP